MSARDTAAILLALTQAAQLATDVVARAQAGELTAEQIAAEWQRLHSQIDEANAAWEQAAQDRSA